jgi:hypothetical protein
MSFIFDNKTCTPDTWVYDTNSQWPLASPQPEIVSLDPNGRFLQIDYPDFVDPLPYKDIRVQLTYLDLLGLPDFLVPDFAPFVEVDAFDTTGPPLVSGGVPILHSIAQQGPQDIFQVYYQLIRSHHYRSPYFRSHPLQPMPHVFLNANIIRTLLIKQSNTISKSFQCT